MYLVGKAGGLPAQRELWGLRQGGKLLIHPTSDVEAERMEELMEQYRDAPMDLADASVVAAAETLEHTTVFTLDQHFRAYRLPAGKAFHVVP